MIAGHYFWPGIPLLALSAGSALWAVTLSGDNRSGRLVWSAFFGIIALLLFVLAYRKSRILQPRPRT
jgi:hypothetical protein